MELPVQRLGRTVDGVDLGRQRATGLGLGLAVPAISTAASAAATPCRMALTS